MNLNLLSLVAVLLSLAMAGAWAVQRATGLSGWIDTIWSTAVGGVSMIAVFFAHGTVDRRTVLLVLIAAWALRLAGHIGSRTKGGHEEDPRYAKFIEEWGDSASWRLFLFLQVQAVVAFVLVLAVFLAATNDTTFPRLVDGLAILIAAVALAGEGIADWQLGRFRRTTQAKTEVCEVGLWHYSRHPNYFFEWLYWCCWPLFAITTMTLSWISLLAPLLMYGLLAHVSGIPPLEDHMLRSRGEKFSNVQQRVNAFFPGPRKNTPSRRD